MTLGAARGEQPGRGGLDRLWTLSARRQEVLAHRKVGAEALPRARAERHHALPAALAGDDEQALVALGRRKPQPDQFRDAQAAGVEQLDQGGEAQRSEEHTSELQSLMRISYAVFCL